MDSLPEKVLVRPRHEAACFSEEDFLEFSSWTNQTCWFPRLNWDVLESVPLVRELVIEISTRNIRSDDRSQVLGTLEWT